MDINDTTRWIAFSRFSKFIDLSLFTSDEITKMSNILIYSLTPIYNDFDIYINIKNSIEELIDDIVQERKSINLDNSSSFGEETLGFEMFIWLSYAGETHNDNHPRLLFSKYYSSDLENYSEITISSYPEFITLKEYVSTINLEKIKKWIILNKQILLNFWNNQNLNILNMEIKSEITRIVR